MAAGRVGDRQQHEAALLHLPDQVLHHRQLRRVHEVVRRVDRQQRCRDPREVRRGVVVLDRVVVVLLDGGLKAVDFVVDIVF